MTGKTHQVIGMTAGLASFLAFAPAAYGPATLAGVIAVSHVAALLPDIDQPGARLWQALPFGRVVGHIINPFLEHRNLSHSFLGMGLVAWGAWAGLGQLPDYWGLDTNALLLASLISYGSHLLGDLITVEGIPLLFPYQRMFGFPPWPFDGVRVLTGKWFENLVIFPLANVALLLTVAYYLPQIRLILFR